MNTGKNMGNNPLGRETDYNTMYNPEILFPVERSKGRQSSGITTTPFTGYDIWVSYEFSWLTYTGRPEVRRMLIVYDCLSENIVESKSLKLYLGSLSMTKFKSEEEVVNLVKKDVGKCLGSDNLEIFLFTSDKSLNYTRIDDEYCLDDLDIKISEYKYNPSLLECEDFPGRKCSDKFFSNLFKSNCPITGQPDWATVFIEYSSEKRIKRASLLKYLISFRSHSDYTENCCERIFHDIYRFTNPEILIVKCFFTRRGGIEINPCRFYGVHPDKNFTAHYWRQ